MGERSRAGRRGSWRRGLLIVLLGVLVGTLAGLAIDRAQGVPPTTVDTSEVSR